MLLMDYTLGFSVTFTGIFIVFMMLLFLVIVLSVFGLFSQIGTRKQTKKIKAVENKNAVENKEPSKTEAPVNSKSGIDNEIIAVISAAVATMYSGSGKKPVIKSVKRSGNSMSAWASAGVRNNTRAF